MNSESRHLMNACLRIHINYAVSLIALCCTLIAAETRAVITAVGNVTPAPPAGTGNVAAPFRIGATSVGQVTINGGSALTVTGGGVIVGDNSTILGILSIDGFGSSLNALAAGADIIVGNSGVGNVSLTNFAQLLIADDFI